MLRKMLMFRKLLHRVYLGHMNQGLWIDAANEAFLALGWPAGTYNIVDDEPRLAACQL